MIRWGQRRPWTVGTSLSDPGAGFLGPLCVGEFLSGLVKVVMSFSSGHFVERLTLSVVSVVLPKVLGRCQHGR